MKLRELDKAHQRGNMIFATLQALIQPGATHADGTHVTDKQRAQYREMLKTLREKRGRGNGNR